MISVSSQSPVRFSAALMLPIAASMNALIAHSVCWFRDVGSLRLKPTQPPSQPVGTCSGPWHSCHATYMPSGTPSAAAPAPCAAACASMARTTSSL